MTDFVEIPDNIIEDTLTEITEKFEREILLSMRKGSWYKTKYLDHLRTLNTSEKIKFILKEKGFESK